MRTWVKIGIVIVSIGIIAGIIYLYFPKVWGDIVYPLKYEDLIIKYSKEFNVDPTFAAAVIYSESHFNPQATSPVGARGLMQIMPATAEGIAQRIGDSSAGDLYNPETSIRYGIYYLHEKLDMYNNNVEAVLAAYNAGGAAANRYLLTPRDDVLPRETVGYLRSVKNAWNMYQTLYSDRLRGENVAEKLKVQQQPQQQTFLEKIVKFLGF